MVIGILLVSIIILALFLFFGAQKKPARKIELKEPQLEEDYYQLYPQYNEDRLVALAKDPNWLFSYWEISEGLKNEFASTYGSEFWEKSQPVMRIVDQTSGAHWDVNVNDYASSWYFRVGQPRHTLYMTLGRTFHGHFYSLLTSNHVTMPAEGPAQEIDPQWPPLEGVWQTLPLSQAKETGSSEYQLHS